LSKAGADEEDLVLTSEATGLGISKTVFNTTINVTTMPSPPAISSKYQKRQREDLEVEIVENVAGSINEMEVDVHESSPEPISPPPKDYTGWTAAALKRDAAARDPPIKVPSKLKAAEAVTLLGPQLQALDAEAKEKRAVVREEKRARAKASEEKGTKATEEPAKKRIKIAEKTSGGEQSEEDDETEVPDSYDDGASTGEEEYQSGLGEALVVDSSVMARKP